MMSFTKLNKFLNLSFLLAILLTSCSVGDDLPSIEEELPEDAILYFSGEVDGEDITLAFTLTNQIVVYNTNGGNVGMKECIFDYGALIISEGDEPPSFGIELKNFFNGFCAEELNVFNTLFPPSRVPFFQEDEFTTDKAVSIEIGTEEGFFTTELGEQASNAKFEITKSRENNNDFGMFQEVEGTISNCRLYHVDDPSKFIELEEGVFKLSLAPFYQ